MTMKLSFRNVVLQEIEDYWLYFHNCFFFFTNLNTTAGEGCLTLADFGDKLTPRGLPVFSLGDMNKTSAKLKYHLEVYSYKCPQKKQNTFCIFCSCSLLQTVSLNR